MAGRPTCGVGVRLRHSLRFFTLCSILDESSTFINLSTGGMEFNPRVSYLLGIHSLIYPLIDSILILGAIVVDKVLRNRVRDIWLIWAAGGIGRLVCFVWGLWLS